MNTHTQILDMFNGSIVNVDDRGTDVELVVELSGSQLVTTIDRQSLDVVVTGEPEGDRQGDDLAGYSALVATGWLKQFG